MDSMKLPESCPLQLNELMNGLGYPQYVAHGGQNVVPAVLTPLGSHNLLIM